MNDAIRVTLIILGGVISAAADESPWFVDENLVFERGNELSRRYLQEYAPDFLPSLEGLLPWVVRIEVQHSFVENGFSSNHGTGAILEGGVVLTANHVLTENVTEGEIKIVITLADGRVLSAAVDEQGESDWARLNLESDDAALLHSPIRMAPPVLDETAVVFGYPAQRGADEEGRVLPFEKGSEEEGVPANRLSPLLVVTSVEDVDTLALDPLAGFPPVGGMSGGPVFNVKGELIAVQSSVSKTTDDATGAVLYYKVNAVAPRAPPRASHHAGEKPNIIFILVDDMGYSDLGCYGGEIRTPNIDGLAKTGLRFTQNYTSARCCPSRAALLTGLYSHQAGIANFTGANHASTRGPAYRGKLSKKAVTLAEVLKTAGYSTYGVGKWHVGHEESPTSRGFDDYFGYTRGHSTSQWNAEKYRRLPEDRAPEFSYADGAFYATDAFSDYAVEFIKQGHEKGQPFFLYLAHSSPHFPLHAPPDSRDTYVEIYRRGWDLLREERYERQKQSGLATSSWRFTERSDVPDDRADIANGFPGQPNPAWDTLDPDRREDLAYRMATFAAMVEHVDRGVGRIVAQLKQTGDFENTLILLTSDNGACYEWGPFGFDTVSRRGMTVLHQGDELENVGGPGTYHAVGSAWANLSNTPLRMYKHFNHEGGNCSPLIAHWPQGIAKVDRWVRSPIHLIDIMPTLCEVTGAVYPETFGGHPIIPMEGTSLKPLFDGSDPLGPRTLCFDHFEASAIRRGDWKLVRGNRRYQDRTWELYHLGRDRCETSNLIHANPEMAQELEQLWHEWAVRVKIEPYYEHPADAQPEGKQATGKMDIAP